MRKIRMQTVTQLGRRSQSRIFVQRGNEAFVTPYWISKKGNLCWKIHEVLYVKLQNGHIMMLNEEGVWVPADATTKATVPGVN